MAKNVLSIGGAPFNMMLLISYGPSVSLNFSFPLAEKIYLLKLNSTRFFRASNLRHFPWMTAICRFSNKLQRLTVSRIIDQFGCERCQKKRKDLDFKLL